MKQTFNIPKGCSKVTIEQIGNKIVTEFEKGFKKGDIIAYHKPTCDNNYVSIYLNNSCELVTYDVDADEFMDSSNMNFASQYFPVFATDKEKQLLFDALTKDGKSWNAETLQIEVLKVEPKVGDYVKLDYGISGFVYCVVKSNNHQIHSNFFLDSLTGVQKYGAFSLYKSIQILTPTQFQSEVNALGFEYDFKNDTFKELRWEPKEGEEIFVLFTTTYGNIKCKREIFNNLEYQIESFGNGFIFKTKSECESAIEKIKEILKIK